jgi:hypothetical protein
VVKLFAFLGLEPRLNIKYGFNWAGKIERFAKVSDFRDNEKIDYSGYKSYG